MAGSIAAHPSPKNAECKNPLEKFSPRFFWDQDGIVLTDYLPKGQTINAEYYSSLLVKVKDILKEKRRGKIIKVVLFSTIMPWFTGHLQPRRADFTTFIRDRHAWGGGMFVLQIILPARSYGLTTNSR